MNNGSKFFIAFLAGAVTGVLGAVLLKDKISCDCIAEKFDDLVEGGRHAKAKMYRYAHEARNTAEEYIDDAKAAMQDKHGKK